MKYHGKRYDKYEAMILTPEEEKAAIYEAKKSKWFRINRGIDGDKENDEWRSNHNDSITEMKHKIIC